MSAVKNKNNIKMWTTDNHKQKTNSDRTITENIGLTEQQKIVIGCDRSTLTQDMSPERLTQPKKINKNIYIYIFLVIKPTLH